MPGWEEVVVVVAGEILRSGHCLTCSFVGLEARQRTFRQRYLGCRVYHLLCSAPACVVVYDSCSRRFLRLGSTQA